MSHHHRREFKIVSEAHHRAVEIQGGHHEADTKVVLSGEHHDHEHGKHQLWYTDDEGHIHSALNDMVFYSDEHGHEHHLRMVHHGGDHRHQWKIEGNKVINGKGECLEIKEGHHHEGAELYANHYNGSANQHWHIKYID
jgi:hypothetical protein